MSATGTIGALGVGTQSAKGTVATTFQYLPATSLNINANQNTQAYPPEVAGSYFPRGSYKAGVTVAGDASLLVRPDGIGHFLFGLAGVDTVTAVPAQAGAFQHVFTPFAPAANTDLPVG